MSAFLPDRPGSGEDGADHPRLLQEPRSPAEQRARWEVRAAQWRALEIARHVFGDVSHAHLSGLRLDGSLRGLLRLDVPFVDLPRHREAEGRFLSAAAADPVLSRVPLVYVIGPDPV